MLALAALCAFAGGDWRQFRGTDNNSVSVAKGLPITFGPRKNVAWKAPLPGRGPASPIVVAGRVVVTCSSGPREDRLHVLCFDAESGKPCWHRQLWATGHTVHDPFGAVAAPTPASNGKLIFALYSSNDLACFDLEGNLKWFRGLAYDHPTMRNDVGMGSSPLALGDVVIVQLENQGESFAAAIDAADGQTRWRIPRDHDGIWSSPTVLRGKTPQEDLVLLQGRDRLSAHDPQTGRQIWQYEASCHTIASATTCGDCVYLPANGLHALRYDPAARNAKLLWYEQRLRSANSSPVVHGGRTYTVKSPGILVCGEAATGKVIWQLRLKGPIWATPLLADGRLYIVNHAGLVQVVELGRQGKLVGTAQIDSGILASPAAADGAIYFRSDAYLWKVKPEPKQTSAASAAETLRRSRTHLSPSAYASRSN